MIDPNLWAKFLASKYASKTEIGIDWNFKITNEEAKQTALFVFVSTGPHETVHYGNRQDSDPDDNTQVFFRKEMDSEGQMQKVYYGKKKDLSTLPTMKN